MPTKEQIEATMKIHFDAWNIRKGKMDGILDR